MNSFLKLSSISAMLWIFIDFCESQSFCESFATNGYRISYGFRRITKTDPFKSYVFINQSYWRLTYMENNDNKTVRLLSEEGKQSNWFGNQFSMAFCVWFGNDCKAGLLSSDMRTITWGDLQESEGELNLKSLSGEESIDFENQNIVTAFVPSAGYMTYKLVSFYRQSPENEYQVFEINDNLTAKKLGEISIFENGLKELEFEPKAVNGLITGLQVIAVMGQYSTFDAHFLNTSILDESDKGHGLIILFQFDKSIKYCYTNTKKISKMCTNKPKILIDCSQTVIRTKGLPESETNVYTLDIIIVVLVVMAFAAIVTSVWYCRRNKIKENDKKRDIIKKSTETLPESLRSTELVH